MKYISTSGRAEAVSFMEAMKNGLAPDGGLYMPKSIPKLEKSFFDNLAAFDFKKIAFEISRHFISGDLSEDQLKSVISDSFNFPLKLRKVERNNFVLELFHGPTLAFKDFGARFMARLFSEQAKVRNERVTILVATSGDTGSAVANGFFNVEGVRVFILYPKGKVSPLQEKQMTTLGGNIHALEVDGVFDDCQRLVKQAFMDGDLAGKMQLSSANSINIARLLPQSFYYAYAVGKVRELDYKKVRFSVPSGNFGNLTGGLLVQKMGMEVEEFIAATNKNNVVPVYLRGGTYSPGSSVQTISNAMDVGDPSNFARIRHLYKFSDEKIRRAITGFDYTDEHTKETILEVYNNQNYLMCPHTAIGYRAANEIETKKETDTASIVLGTAHPAKFREHIEPLINTSIDLPASIKHTAGKEKISKEITSEYKVLKSVLLQSK